MDAIATHRPQTVTTPAGTVATAIAPQSAPHDTLVPRPVAQAGNAGARSASDDGSTRGKPAGSSGDDEAARLRDLRARDREVRAHERAHLAAAGAHASGGASYSFEVGPDQRRYAVAGEVQIDTAAVPGDPQATLAKAAQVQRAALAPAEPSAQDRRVAAQAAAMAATARAELAQQRADRAVDAYRLEDTGQTAAIHALA